VKIVCGSESKSSRETNQLDKEIRKDTIETVEPSMFKL